MKEVFELSGVLRESLSSVQYTSGIQYMREVDELTSVALRKVAASREVALLYAL